MSTTAECSCKTVIRPGQFHKHGCPVEPSPPPPGAAAPDGYPYTPAKRPGLAGAPRPRGEPSEVDVLRAERDALIAELADLRVQLAAARPAVCGDHPAAPMVCSDCSLTPYETRTR